MRQELSADLLLIRVGQGLDFRKGLFEGLDHDPIIAE
jgi:hypothetical protein